MFAATIKYQRNLWKLFNIQVCSRKVNAWNKDMLMVAHDLAKLVTRKVCCNESIIPIWTLVQRKWWLVCKTINKVNKLIKSGRVNLSVIDQGRRCCCTQWNECGKTSSGLGAVSGQQQAGGELMHFYCFWWQNLWVFLGSGNCWLHRQLETITLNDRNLPFI